MTPPFEFSGPRRSFVKKTLATSASISFAGLIRAHGEEGGGTASSTYSTGDGTISTSYSTGDGTAATSYATGDETMTTSYSTGDGTYQSTMELVTTAAPKNPALFKQDPAHPTNPAFDVGDMGPEALTLWSHPGQIKIIDLRRTNPTDNPYYEANVWWKLALKGVIAPPERSADGKVVLKECECCKITVSSEYGLVVKEKPKKQTDPANSFDNDIMGWLRSALKGNLPDLPPSPPPLHNPPPPYDPSKEYYDPGVGIIGRKFSAGVSCTALVDPSDSNKALVESDGPNAIEKGSKVKLALETAVTPDDLTDAASKEVKWTVRPPTKDSGGFAGDEGKVLDLAKAALETWIKDQNENHGGKYSIEVWQMPKEDFPGDPQFIRYQRVKAGMAPGYVKTGNTCELEGDIDEDDRP